MRSLYNEDIPGTIMIMRGAKPVKRVYDKSLIRARHNEEIDRFGSNPEHRIIDWYYPVKKVPEPLDRQDDAQWRTKKTLQRAFQINEKDLSKSTALEKLIRTESLGSVEPRLQKSSILSGSGQKSLNTSIHDDPYFPHRYIDSKGGEKNKWSGTRSWVD